MLRIHIQTAEAYDEESSQFVSQGVDLDLEHSLDSLSKWEAKFRKAFLSDEEKTAEETIWYITTMILTPDYPPDILHLLTEDHVRQINEYINKTPTATTIQREQKRSGVKEKITYEVIVHWMVSLNIPMECQYWHLGRLFTLIEVANIKNTPQKKLSRREVMERNRALNEKRMAELGTRG